MDVFGTDGATEIAKLTDKFRLAHLGSAVAGSLFYCMNIGTVSGIELADGRRVVIKARPPLQTNPGVPSGRRALEGVIAVMHELADSGFLCPRPLLSPSPMGRGIATAAHGIPMDWSEKGIRRHPTDDVVRALVADEEEARNRPFGKSERAGRKEKGRS